MRRATFIVLVLVLALTAATPAQAASDRAERRAEREEFTFFGSGFGHGLGMSQWGAYGLSQQGWSAPRILTHYYSGTRVGGAGRVPKQLRIGLIQGRGSVRLEAESGDVELRLGNRRTGDVVATVPSGQTWRVRVAGNGYQIVDAGGGTVGTVGSPTTSLFAVFQPQGAIVRVPEAGHAYNRGWIEFGLYDCSGGCAMRLVLEITPQEYLYGLGEVPSSWPKPALQAQAIAARTYALTKAATSQHRAGCDCALYASSFDQVYAGWDKEGGLDGNRWVAAVNATRDKVVVDRGDTIQAFYMSSSGGFTEDNENVWGGTPIDYLRGVCDPGDFTTANPSATWDITFGAANLTEQLSLGIGTVTGFVNAQRGVSGRIVSVTVNGLNGSQAITGAALRSALGLRDDRVWINKNRQITGEIRAKYDALGCSPGLPVSRQVAVAGGLRQAFEDASIFFKDGVGAFELTDPVLGFYLSEGGPGGRLGFPTSDARRMPNGNERATFEHGTITCTNAACMVD
ncbi:MAG: SpoIID/LytB domain-containing protein [Actinomycetota bacterium]